jgi:predicted aspartyl protease
MAAKQNGWAGPRNRTEPARPICALSLAFLQLLIVPAAIALNGLPACALTGANHGATAPDTIIKATKTSSEAKALADQILEALGGYENFKEFNDMPCRARGKIIQTSSISNVINTFECDILVKREKQRITIKSFLGAPLTTGYDGTVCWTQQGDSILPSDKETARRIEEDIQHGFLLLESLRPMDGAPPAIMQVGKSAVIEGEDCDALIVWAADGIPTTFYADKKKHLILASSYPGIDLEQGIKIEKIYHYLDYRPIDKTVQPYKVVEYSGSKKVSDTIIESITLDNTVSDAEFSMPKEIVPPRLLAGSLTVPFDYSSNEIIIQATVNGTKDLRFIIDTGATQSILDRALARELGTPTDANLSMTTGAGSIQTEALQVDKLTIGDLQLTKVPFATADLASFGATATTKTAGLLGANVLKRFLMTIDYENQKLTFADPNKVEVPAGAAAIKTVPSLGMAGIAVEGNLDGKQKVTFLIDTGAAFDNISESKVSAILPGPLFRVGLLKGLDGKPVQTASARFNYLDLDGLRIDKPVFSVAPEAVAGQLSAGIIHSKDLAILGNPTLSHYTVTFDYRGQRLIFSQSKGQKAAAEFRNKIDAIKLEWLKTNNANPAVRELSNLADLAHNRDLPALEAVVRSELALALCQKNGGMFSPDHLFTPIKTEELLSDGEAASSKDGKPISSEKLFSEAEEQLLTAFNISEHCVDKSVQGRVLAAWGLMYASQNKDIRYLSSAKQKLGKAVVLAPSDADVLAASGYFLSRLESFKPPEAAESAKKSAAKSAAQTPIEHKVERKGASRPGAPAAAGHLPEKAQEAIEKTPLPFKTDRDKGRFLVDQIVDQAIMIDPANWLALWTKYERLKSQGKTEDMKLVTTQIKRYYPTVNLTPYLR